MKRLTSLLFLSFISCMSTTTLPMLDFLGFHHADAKDNRLHVAVGLEEKRAQVTTLEGEIKSLQDGNKKFFDDVQEKLAQVSHQINTIKTSISSTPPDRHEFLTTMLSLLNDLYQALINLQVSRKQQIEILQKHIKLLGEYLKDPEFRAYAIEKKSFYTFATLEQVSSTLEQLENTLTAFLSEKKEATIELDLRTKKARSTERILKEKQKAQTDFNSRKANDGTMSEIDLRQKGELLDLEEKLAASEQNLAEVRLTEANDRMAYITNAVNITNDHIRFLKEQYAMIKHGLRVDTVDVASAKEAYEKKKNESLYTSKTYLQEIEALSVQRAQVEAALATFRQQLQGDDALTLDKNWNIDPKTVTTYANLCYLGVEQERIDAINKRIELLRSQIDLRKASLQFEELGLQILQSWFKIKQRLFSSTEEITEESKKYNDVKAELNREIAVLKDKRNTVTEGLNHLNTSLTNLQNLRNKLRRDRTSIFQNDTQSYIKTASYLQDAEKLINMQLESVGRLIEVSSKTLGTLQAVLRRVTAMLAELDTLSLWYRSGEAISWDGVKNILPDLRQLSIDLMSMTENYFSSANLRARWTRTHDFFSSPVALGWALLKLLLLILLFLLLGRLLPYLQRKLLFVKTTYRGIALSANTTGTLCDFIARNFGSMFIWACAFIFIGRRGNADLYPTILFYIISIFYLFFIIHRLMRHLRAFNISSDYALVSQSFQARFFTVLGIFLYVTVGIFFFREVFILATYTKSELPTILLAIYSVVVRTLLICLIGKDEVLGLIPATNRVWEWLRYNVIHYYYPLLLLVIVLMILSDPYIGGLGNLVSHIFWGVIGTIIIGRVLFVAHNFTRRTSSYIFFSSDDDSLKERFPYARSLYGLTIIVLFALFAFLALVLLSYLWGKPISLEGMHEWISAKNFSIGIGENQKRLSYLDLLRTLLFIPLGFVVSFIVDRYVLGKVFSLLLVNQGIHNTVSSLTHYIIILTVVLVGLWQEGLGFLIIYFIGPILIGLAVALKDSFSNFIAYFIILIQRPVKIGDFIELDPETTGVVRRINPFSVILRRKNSFTIVVPNTKIISTPVSNWNYTDGFIALDDIVFTIGFTCSPSKARALMLQVLNGSADILKNPAPIIRLDNFVDHGYYFMVRAFTSSINTLRKWEIASDIRFAFVAIFAEHCITFATPIRFISMTATQPQGGEIPPLTPPQEK